jgi:hypothetical protein
MDTLLIGLGIIAATALASGWLLFGVKPQPVTDPTANVGIPDSELKETFGRWKIKRNRWVTHGFVTRFRSLILVIFWLCAATAAVALLAGLVALFAGIAITNALK